MQIGNTDVTGVSSILRTALSDASQANATTQANANAAQQAAPLKGGSRVFSSGIFLEAEDSETATNLTPATLADLVLQQSKRFATTLGEALKAVNIPVEHATFALQVDGAGRVIAEGGYKDEIDKLLAERPELEKEAKNIAALNAIVALNAAMRRFSLAKKSARTDDERAQAQAAYITDCLEIQARSNTLVMVEGKLVSSAIVYMAQR